MKEKGESQGHQHYEFHNPGSANVLEEIPGPGRAGDPGPVLKKSNPAWSTVLRKGSFRGEGDKAAFPGRVAGLTTSVPASREWLKQGF